MDLRVCALGIRITVQRVPIHEQCATSMRPASTEGIYEREAAYVTMTEEVGSQVLPQPQFSTKVQVRGYLYHGCEVLPCPAGSAGRADAANSPSTF